MHRRIHFICALREKERMLIQSTIKRMTQTKSCTRIHLCFVSHMEKTIFNYRDRTKMFREDFS